MWTDAVSKGGSIDCLMWTDAVSEVPVFIGSCA